MKKYLNNTAITLLFGAAAAALISGCCAVEEKRAPQYDVAAYYWPAYHPDPRWKELGVFNDGNAEWQNVYEAKPRFEGHDQPKVPLWGYDDESDPKAMAKRIDAAADHGVNVFIFDWYWYRNSPFLEKALDDGFLKAENRDRVQFYLMWANHDFGDVCDNTVPVKNQGRPTFDGGVSIEEFKKVADRTVKKYFTQPNHYKIDGKPVYCIYEISTFIKGMGGVEKAREALDYFRESAKKAGFPGVHIQGICMKMAQKAQGLSGSDLTSPEIAESIGIDSFTSYQWVHYRAPADEDYADWGGWNVKNWDTLQKEFEKPFYAHVTIGWDNNPRYPVRRPMVMRTNPEDFEKFLMAAKEWTDRKYPNGPKLVTINSWNEWTEGGYLEPDMTHGWAYLEAVKRVFTENKN